MKQTKFTYEKVAHPLNDFQKAPQMYYEKKDRYKITLQ